MHASPHINVSAYTWMFCVLTQGEGMEEEGCRKPTSLFESARALTEDV